MHILCMIVVIKCKMISVQIRFKKTKNLKSLFWYTNQIEKNNFILFPQTTGIYMDGLYNAKTNMFYIYCYNLLTQT